MQFSPVRFGCVGLGGYAQQVIQHLEEAGPRHALPIKLRAVCDPDLVRHRDQAARLRALGVAVYENHADLLNHALDMVWLPLPIHLHRDFTEQALAAGKAVLCEKPAAGSVQDVDAMIRARDRARRPVVVGFQDIYKPETRQIKRALVDGKIGRIRSASLKACWPRAESYFSRSDWAGKLRNGDRWTLDSPAQNALAHFVHLLLFLLGDTEAEAATPARVEAELYRANDIENYDTCGLRITTSSGIECLVLLTHACAERVQPEIQIHGETGQLDYLGWRQAILSSGHSAETFMLSWGNQIEAMLGEVARLVGGHVLLGPVATLELARAHTVVVNAASEATPIHAVPSTLHPVDGGPGRCIAEIEALFEACVRQGRLPHETGLAPWTRPAGVRETIGYHHFEGPHRQARSFLPVGSTPSTPVSD
jgi:predicted dehydrogenase